MFLALWTKYDAIRTEAFTHIQGYTMLDSIKVVANDYGARNNDKNTHLIVIARFV